MATDILKVHSNERIDLNDFAYLADESLQGLVRQMPGEFMVDPDKRRRWIIDGFEATQVPATEQVQVTRGRALLGQREGGLVFYSVLTTEGDPTKIVDASVLPNGNYGVYVRFEYVEGETASRVFWNPAGLGSEFAQTVTTRRLANWSMRMELTSPGAEWEEVARVNVVGGAITLITDTRYFYFEGSTDDSYESGWSSEGGGVANDRNADRAQYGVHDLQTFTAAMRQCIEDLKGRGLRRWWDKGIGGMNVGFDDDPVEDGVYVGDFSFGLRLLSPTHGVLDFDLGDYLSYDRTNDRLGFLIGAFERMRLETDGLRITSGLVVGHTGTPVADRVSVGDSSFYMDLGGSNPVLNFASTDYLQYDRTANELDLFIGGSSRMTISQYGLTHDGQIAAAGGFPLMQGDGSTWSAFTVDSFDYLYYSRSADEWIWYIGNVERMALTSSGLEIAGGLVVGYAGTPGTDEIRVGDANFKMHRVDANHVRLEGDANDYLEYDRADDRWRVRAGNVNAQEVWNDGTHSLSYQYLGTHTIFVTMLGSKFLHSDGPSIWANEDNYILDSEGHLRWREYEVIAQVPMAAGWTMDSACFLIESGTDATKYQRWYMWEREWTNHPDPWGPGLPKVARGSASVSNLRQLFTTYDGNGWFIVDDTNDTDPWFPFTMASHKRQVWIYGYTNRTNAQTHNRLWMVVLEFTVPTVVGDQGMNWG